MTSDSQDLPAKLGRYVLEHSLAKGGMAEIFLARQEGPGGFSRELVIKRILSTYAKEPGFVEMFLDEAKLAARLSHPNIVPIYDFGEADGAYFLAMELVRGPDVRNVLEAMQATQRRLPFPVLARIVSDAAMGLEHAHRLTGADGRLLHIIHRDISPSNLIVSYDGVTKVLDFGIAKADHASHKTRTGYIKGKFAYMPPEQIQGDPLDARVDVYALGVVLFELCAGRPPFSEESDYRLMKTICERPPSSPRDFAPDIPSELEEIILKAISKDPALRFPSARALAAVLDRFGVEHGGPVSAFDVAEEILELKRSYGKPLTVLALAGLTDGSASQPSIRERGSKLEGAPESESGEHSLREEGQSKAVEAAASDSSFCSEATVLRPGLSEAPAGQPPADGEATLLRPGLGIRTPAQSPQEGISEDTVFTPGLPRAMVETEEPVLSDEEIVTGGVVTTVSATPGRHSPGARRQKSTSLASYLFVVVGLALVGMVGTVMYRFMTDEDVETGPQPFAAAHPIERATPAAVPGPAAPEQAELVAEDSSEEQDAIADLSFDHAEPEEGSTRQEPDPSEETRPAHGDASREMKEPAEQRIASGPPTPRTERPARRAASDEQPSKTESTAPARLGFVMVQSQPWANIHYRGEMLGPTPMRVELPAGTQELVLRHPDSGLERAVTVQVKEGETARLSVSLGEGRVAVLVRPYGEVWVAGERRGVTPMPPLVLASGRHTIEVVHPETGQRRQEMVEVVAGETVTLRVDLSE